MDKYELTPEEKNVLKEYINTPSGKKLLLVIANQELNLLAEGYGLKTSTERQVQIMNKTAGIYWVRTLLGDLTK